MIILRQKQYAAKDFEGVNTALGAKMLQWKRNRQASKLMKARKQNNAALQGQIAAINQGAQTNLDKLGNTGLNAKSQEVVRRNILNKNQADVNAAIQARNAHHSEALGSVKRSKVSTASRPVKTPEYNVSEVTSTYKAPVALPKTAQTQSGNAVVLNNQTLQQKQGIGTMGKVAIGAGVAAAGYGAYRILKARRERKEAEEEQENKQRRQA